jgi:hypothetical protein
MGNPQDDQALWRKPELAASAEKDRLSQYTDLVAVTAAHHIELQ